MMDPEQLDASFEQPESGQRFDLSANFGSSIWYDYNQVIRSWLLLSNQIPIKEETTTTQSFEMAMKCNLFRSAVYHDLSLF